MAHQITLSEAIAAEMMDGSSPQRLMRTVDLAVEVVGVDGYAIVDSAWHCRPGSWISGNLLDQVLLRWTEVRWQHKSTDNEVRITLKADPYTYRDISFAVILAVAHHHRGDDIRIGFPMDLCQHPSDRDILSDDDLIAQIVAQASAPLQEARS